MTVIRLQRRLFLSGVDDQLQAGHLTPPSPPLPASEIRRCIHDECRFHYATVCDIIVYDVVDASDLLRFRVSSGLFHMCSLINLAVVAFLCVNYAF